MTIRSQLLFSFLATSLIPLILVMSIALYQGAEETHSLKRRAMVATIEKGAESINRFFTTRMAEITLYSEQKDVRSMDFAKMRPFLMDKLSHQNQIYEKFIIGTPEGYFYNTSGGNPHQQGLRTFDDASPNARLKHIRKRDYWKQTIGKNKQKQDVTYVSNPMISYTTGVKQVVVASSILNEKQELVGLIGGALPWDTINNLVADTKNQILDEFPSHTRFMMIARNGIYWYHWDPDRIIRLDIQEGKLIKDDIGEHSTTIRNILKEPNVQLSNIGNKMVAGVSGSDYIKDEHLNMDGYLFYAPIKNAGYSIAAYVDKSAVTSSSDTLQMIFLVLTIITLLIIVTLVLWLTEKLSKPLMQLSKTLEEKSEDEQFTPIPLDGPQEIVEIKRSINQTIERLGPQKSAHASNPYADKQH
ncbi:cache domain-containing protein [Litoribrevibacter albus]|uniref:HAMP domain-containing protein n=1 Tax=Litoribrevibacter albus TaxID=1473156 RepID=A0AA37SF45_9GAMM|nr:hypothetical protein [Litoribrevibacter albus]GLQ32944.1 hypothetical protein GCM10007876_34230 [Litoribrevibacter albus]